MPTTATTAADQLLRQARAGSGESLGRLLELYKNYLRILVLAQLQRRVRGRVSPSDVVQETFFEAHRDFGHFRGATAGEFLAWLRQILVNNLHRVIERHVLAERRDVRREVSVEQVAASLEQSTARLESVLADGGRSPSADAGQREMQLRLADELAALAEDYRDVIVMRHIEGLPFEQIGKRMDRSAGAARMVWLRAIKHLRARLTEVGSTAGGSP